MFCGSSTLVLFSLNAESSMPVGCTLSLDCTWKSSGLKRKQNSHRAADTDEVKVNKEKKKGCSIEGRKVKAAMKDL